MGKENLLGTCPYCGSLYYMDEEDDKGYCGREECAKKAGKYKAVETKLAAGGKIVEFTQDKEGSKVEISKEPKNKVILKKPIDIEKRKTNVKKGNKKTAKPRTKKAKSRRVSK